MTKTTSTPHRLFMPLALLLILLATSRAQTPGCPNPIFGSISGVTMGGYHSDVELADLNQDGLLDLVVAEDDTAFAATAFFVGVRLGGPLGSFGPEVRHPVGNRPQELGIEDFDQDGNLDLAVACSGVSDVWILFGDGSGAFPTTTAISLPGLAVSLTTGDFDGDGIPDLMVPTYFGDLVWLRGDGNGGFVSTTTAIPGSALRDIEAEDLDGDGDLDLLVVAWIPDGVFVHLGNGDGSFAPPVHLATTRDPAAVSCGDLDGDGDLDLAVASHWLSSTITVYSNTGTGTFNNMLNLDAGSGSSSIEIVDLDQNGTQDLVLANEWGQSVSLLRGDGSGGFSPPENFSVPGNVLTAEVGDLDLDGFLDVVASHLNGGLVAVLKGRPDGTLGPSLRHSVGVAPFGVQVEDMDRDGDLEILTRGLNGVEIHTRTPNGFALSSTLAGTSGYQSSFATQDENEDGYPDVAVITPYSLLLHRSDGQGGFHPPVILSSGVGPMQVGEGDWNGDGHTDYAVGFSGDDGSTWPVIPGLTVHLGSGGGAFASSTLTTSYEPHAIATADWNGDGNEDLIATDAANALLHIHPGDGNGGFGTQQTLPLQSIALGIETSDLDRDGDVDLVLPCGQANQVMIYWGDGSGAVVATTTLPSADEPTAIDIADLDHDGHLDLSVVNTGWPNESIQVFSGNGLGNFSAHAPIPTGLDPRDIAIGDLDGDGNHDLVFTQRNGDSVTIEFNLCNALAIDLDQIAGPGSPLFIHDFNLPLGEEIYNVISLDLCPGPPGSGPPATFGLCITTPMNTQFIIDQLQSPIGSPFHFSATTPVTSFGPFPVGGLAGVSFEVLAVSLQSTVTQASAVRRYTIR